MAGTRVPGVEAPDYLVAMAQDLRFHALERRRSSPLSWLLVVAVVGAVVGAVSWGLTRAAASEQVVRELGALQSQAEQYRKALADRDCLLAGAHEEGDLLRSPGQALGILYRVAEDATESGIVVADPARHAARLYLYGLVAPAGSGEYAAVARGADGARKVLGRILPDDSGSGFLLAGDVPAGTAAIELAFRPPGRDAVEEDQVRVSARYPKKPAERGVLVQQPVEARSGKRR